MDIHFEHKGWRVLPCALAYALLAACGSGGGGSGMVRSDPVVTDPQPVATPPSDCPNPQVSDCVVVVPYANDHSITGGRSSDHALRIRGDGGTTKLESGDYRFAGGTYVESAAALRVQLDATLRSDIAVAAPGHLYVWGGVEGDVANDGTATLGGTVTGNWTNDGSLLVSTYSGDPVPRISGAFVQGPTGTLAVEIGGESKDPLVVEGVAQLDGTLEIRPFVWWWGEASIPVAPYTHHVLTAGGGVSGTFDAWTSPSLFITGNVRYAANDVWFDASRISAQAVMQGAAGDAMTVNAARAYDRILAVTDAMPRDVSQLDDAQRRFLLSAATIQRIGDLAQAVRTFDSISGHGHLAAMDAQLQHALQSAPRIGAHAGRVPLHASGAWSASPDVSSVRGASFAQGQAFGYDAWIGERLLLGGRVETTDSVMAVDREGGVARGRAPAVHFSLHRVGDNGWHTTGLLGASRQTMRLERPIDLGAARGAAMSERNTDLAYAWVETARDIRTDAGTITPFASLGYAAMHGDAFVEHGNTGFELAGLPSRYERLQGDAGVRYAKGWRWGNDGWTRLGLGARWRHAFYANDTLQVAFTGAPQVMFDVAGMPTARTDRLWELDFTGGMGDRWSWTMRYEDGADDRALSLGMALGF